VWSLSTSLVGDRAAILAATAKTVQGHMIACNDHGFSALR
jgi:hypothetical protein